MVTRFLDISKSHRKKDDNGFLIITQNPIAKSGVFEYLKSEILPDFKGDDGLVKVYRPFEALKKAKDSKYRKWRSCRIKPCLHGRSFGKFGQI